MPLDRTNPADLESRLLSAVGHLRTTAHGLDSIRQLTDRGNIADATGLLAILAEGARRAADEVLA